MHLSVTQDCFLTVQGQDGLAKQVNIQEALGVQKVFDWFGNTHPVNVLKVPQEEKRYMLGSTNGELMTVGASHTILCRDVEDPRWKRRSILDIKEPVFVQLPQRKILGDPELFEYFDYDDTGPHLKPDRPSQLADVSRRAAWSGVTVSRHKTENRIDLDKRRPACFSTKYFAGSFQRDLEKTLGNFVLTTLVKPPCLFDDDYLYKVRKTGIIFEGASFVNNVPLLPPKALEKEGPVYHIRLDSPMTPVELMWFHS
jgi:hypothetical protein